MIRRSVLSFFMALAILSVAGSAIAASQSTFSVSPPPIATPVFDTKETDLKVGATYLTMKSTDPANDFKLSGYGINAVSRKAFGNMLAIDYAVGVMYMSGDIGLGSGLTGTGGTGGPGSKLKLSGVSIPFSFNLEVQPYKNDMFNVIVFAGPALNITEMSLRNVPTVIATTVIHDTWTINSIMYGLQGGLQMGLGFGDIHVDAFGMAMSQKGTQTVSTSFSDDTSDVPAVTTTSFGVDFTYVPWGLSLSSILQEAKGDNKSGTKTTMYQLSWSHKF
jgi:hypothetical protein